MQQVEALLVERLGCEHVVCEDISGGCGQSFDLVEVVTPAFEGKNRLKRHRLVRKEPQSLRSLQPFQPPPPPPAMPSGCTPAAVGFAGTPLPLCQPDVLVA